MLRIIMRGNILRKFKHFFKSSEQAQKEYLLSQGLKIGQGLICYSWNGIDSNWPWLISIGNNVLISTDVKVLAHDTSCCWTNGYTKIGQVKIGNNVFIGTNSLILCNTVIGDNVIIGGGAVVTGKIPSNSVVVGNPARVISSFEQLKEKHKMALANHHLFDEIEWNKWIDADDKMKAYMIEQLEKKRWIWLCLNDWIRSISFNFFLKVPIPECVLYWFIT